MRGYIALSRVKAATDVLVAQPFNPLLFRLGRQSYPTLLFDVLLGKVDFQDLQRECTRATTESKQSKLLRDEEWQCWDCGKRKVWNQYFAACTLDGQDPEWQKNYSTFILKFGCLRRCMSCRQLHGDNTVSELVAEENVVGTSRRGWHK
eukprot:2158119-Karenia_brevis.AAC.1